MSITNLQMFHSDGRLRGSYVYMLLCRDEGPIYVKVGLSNTPSKRLQALRTGCPVTPRMFAFLEVRSRERAKRLEAALHLAFDKWRTCGEWFRLTFEEKAEFNQAWKQVFEEMAETGWPMRWEQVSVQSLHRYWERRKNYLRMKFRRSGRAYRDYVRDGGRRAGCC